jgi:3' terminal RNA ribose 2'-O-methyltransferase Hen1
VSADEVDKLLRAGGAWLQAHPARDLIVGRYLAHQRSLVSDAVDRLAELDDSSPEEVDAGADEEAAAPQAPRETLAEQRAQGVLEVLRDRGAARVLDLGCGEGLLLRHLLSDARFTEVVGVDVSDRALRAAERRLNVAHMPDKQRERLELWQSALTYRDRRLRGFDAAVLMEVVEHVDPPRLAALEDAVFADAQPTLVIVTTPNVEHNVLFPWLPAGRLRHPDHRFEWDRAQFQQWARQVAGRWGYHVRFLPVGDDDHEVGPPTQMAVFDRSVTGEVAS